MLAFITSLRHPFNSNDYARVEEIFFTSLTSWLSQEDQRCFVVVVGNQPPARPLPPSVRFVQVDYEPPSMLRGPQTGGAAVLRDKGTKLAVGLLAAREVPELTHIMFVDADDFVSRRLATFVAEHPNDLGWTSTRGYRYNADRRALRFHDGDFHLQCGSSHIVRHDIYPMPDLPVTASQDDLYRAFGDTLERWIGSHMYIRDDLHLPDLPFPGALYRVGSGESHSGNSMGSLGRPVSKDIAHEFGVPTTGWKPWNLARSILPSTQAITHRLSGVGRRVRR